MPVLRSGPGNLERIRREYPSQVRLVFRHYPLEMHPHAQKAHEASIEVLEQAGAEGFWRYHDLLFERPQQLERADLQRYAEQIPGIDIGRFRRALDRGIHYNRVGLGARALADVGVHIGTPTFLINDVIVRGAQPYEHFREIIETQLGASR